MRSLALHEFKKNLSSINNQLSHYVFIHEQFLIDNREKAKDFPDKFTDEVYLTNQLSSQFKVRLREIEGYSIETSYFIYDSFLVFCFLELENYLKEIYKQI